jgi:hypothetical protein
MAASIGAKAEQGRITAGTPECSSYPLKYSSGGAPGGGGGDDYNRGCMGSSRTPPGICWLGTCPATLPGVITQGFITLGSSHRSARSSLSIRCCARSKPVGNSSIHA